MRMKWVNLRKVLRMQLGTRQMHNKLVVRLQEDVALASLESRQGDVREGNAESVSFVGGPW